MWAHSCYFLLLCQHVEENLVKQILISLHDRKLYVFSHINLWPVVTQRLLLKSVVFSF